MDEMVVWFVVLEQMRTAWEGRPTAVTPIAVGLGTRA